MSSRDKKRRKFLRREAHKIIGNCVNCDCAVKRDEAFPNFWGANVSEMWGSVSCQNCIALYAQARQLAILIKRVIK